MNVMQGACAVMVMMCVVMGCKSTPDATDEQMMEPPEQQATAKPPVKEEVKPPCAEDDENCRVDRLGDTRIGWIDGSVNAAIMLDKLGEPSAKEPRLEEGATGDIYEVWRWEEHGIEADITAPDMTAEVVGVRHFTVSAPFEGKTARGIGIGSTEQEVLKVYADAIDPMSRPGESIIAGSVYGGMFFRIEGGKVTSIFVGAGAE